MRFDWLYFSFVFLSVAKDLDVTTKILRYAQEDIQKKSLVKKTRLNSTTTNPLRALVFI